MKEKSKTIGQLFPLLIKEAGRGRLSDVYQPPPDLPLHKGEESA